MAIAHRRGYAAHCLFLLACFAAAAPAAGDGALDALRQEMARKAQAAATASRTAVRGRDGWLFFAPELRHLSVGRFWGAAAPRVSRAADPRHADPLPAIVDFKRQLDRAKVELLVVPVPPKAVVYPEMLLSRAGAAAYPHLDAELRAFYALLRKSGVNVLDLTAQLKAGRLGPHGPVFCRQDTHWSSNGCVTAAVRIAAHVKTRPWSRTVPRRRYTARWTSASISGDLSGDAGPGGGTPAPEKVALRSVGTPSGSGLAPVAPSRSSPVLVLGDSHTLVFHAGDDMLATGAGLPDQLAYELGYPVDLVGVRGSGATPARVSLMRLARSQPGYLRGKRLVVWCFGAREFTEATGWQKVPVAP